MSELQIERCDSCGSAWFPARLRCPRCGGSAFTPTSAGAGIVEEISASIASVRLDAGPVVIARVESRAGTGARVVLDRDAGGQIRARNAPPHE